MHPPSIPPYLQSIKLLLIFPNDQPLLVLALEEYFISPTEHTLAHLFTSLNEMDLTQLPTLTYLERTILIASDNKDMFREKFAIPTSPLPPTTATTPRTTSTTMGPQSSGTTTATMTGTTIGPGGEGTSPQSTHSRELSRDSLKRRTFINLTSGNRFQLPNQVGPKDCHFFETKIVYTGRKIPIQIPITATADIVGDVPTSSSPPQTTHVSRDILQLLEMGDFGD